MKKLRWLALLFGLLIPSLAHAQYSPTQGWCEDGNKRVVTVGLSSTNPVQASYSACTVTVAIHGGGAATIYSNATGTPLANPFTANANGQWQFFALANFYDITITGGTPVMPGPVTFSSVPVVGTGGGSVTSFSSGNLAPLFTTSVATATTTPAQSFALSTAAANKVFGNCTGSTAVPTYCTPTNAMLPAPGSSGQMIYNSSGLFGATTGVTWDDTNRRMSWVNAGNTAFLSLQPGTISFDSAGGVTASRISAVFSAFDFIAAVGTDINISQSGAHHFLLPASNNGLAQLGEGGSAGTLQLNDGVSVAGVFQGPIIRASTATPEASITARVGSLYLRTNGAATTSAYLKESGTGNTGWQQFAMQDDTQTITNKSLVDASTYFINSVTASKRANFNLAGSTINTLATLTFATTVDRAYTFPDVSGNVCVSTGTCSATQFTSTIATGTAPFAVTSTTPVANLSATPTTYGHTGTQLTNAHIVIDSCTLGTDCAVTLTGAAVFTSSTSYTCNAQDQTAAAATKVVQASGSGFTITGTGTDSIRYSCKGD